jgi:hypothetical protein
VNILIEVLLEIPGLSVFHVVINAWEIAILEKKNKYSYKRLHKYMHYRVDFNVFNSFFLRVVKV